MGDLGLAGSFGAGGAADALETIMARRMMAQKYADFLKQQEFDNATKTRQVDISEKLANTKETPHPMVVGAGASLVEPTSGRILASVPKAPERPMSVAPGASLVEPGTGRIITSVPDRTPKEPTPHFSAQDRYDENGKPQSGVLNTLTGAWTGTPGQGSVHAPPGAGQLAVQDSKKKEAQSTLGRLDQDIDAAAPLLGPTAGRISDLEQFIGNADPKVSTLAARMVAAKMQVDAGIGGMRGAASPQLLARWDKLMGMQMNPENLHAVAQVMREMVGGQTGAAPSGVRVTKITPIP